MYTCEYINSNERSATQQFNLLNTINDSYFLYYI